MFQYEKGPPSGLFNRLDLFSVSSIGSIIDLSTIKTQKFYYRPQYIYILYMYVILDVKVRPVVVCMLQGRALRRVKTFVAPLHLEPSRSPPSWPSSRSFLTFISPSVHITALPHMGGRVHVTAACSLQVGELLARYSSSLTDSESLHGSATSLLGEGPTGRVSPKALQGLMGL